jgi:hypothetical protein
MKKIFSISLTLLLAVVVSNTSFAQIRKIPAEVTSSFTAKYPQATEVEWRDKLTSFAASFNIDGTDYVATFSNKGEWENTEQGFDQNDLPKPVQDGFEKSKYADWDVNQVIKIEMPDDVIQYRIEVSKGDINKKNLYFNSNGRMLKDKRTL